MGNYNRDDRSGQKRDYGRRDFGKRDFGGRSDKKEMHSAVCAKCGKDCEVPFSPSDGRPVFCSDCFEKKEGGTSSSRNFSDRGSRSSSFEKRSDSRPQNNEQINDINLKLDKIIQILTDLSIEK